MEPEELAFAQRRFRALEIANTHSLLRDFMVKIIL